MNNETKSKKERNALSARERAAAVLSVWTERRRPSEVCQELAINSGLLALWQQRALEGMLQALEPRRRADTEKGPALSVKLERLLTRQTARAEGKLLRLEKRLLKLQDDKLPQPAKAK